MKKIVYLQGIGELEQAILTKLKKQIEWELKGYIRSVELAKNSIPLYDSEYNSVERQYDANKILFRIKKIFQRSNRISVLGIIDEDLYSRFKIMLFGIAEEGFLSLPGIALISITRLKETFYNRPDDIALFELRVFKEALHELGHTFTLKHCEHDCIMQYSKNLAAIDRKPPHFCDSCLILIKEYFNNIDR